MAKGVILGLDRVQAQLNGIGRDIQGNWMKRLLSRVIGKVQTLPHANIGFLEGATYPSQNAGNDKSGLAPGEPYENGLPVAVIAFLNEFGGTIDIPEHETTVYRSIKADGTFKKNGRFVKRSRSNFATSHTVEAHTVTIPARAFMRATIAENQDRWGQILAASIRQSKGDIPKALAITAEGITAQVQEQIRSIARAGGNKPSTVRAKGFDSPLIDTGHLLNSVGYEVVRD